MPTIQYDYLTPARHRLAGATATYKMFRRVWGTHVVDGIEVYDGALIYYYDGVGVRDDLSFNRFINKIGIQRKALTGENYTDIDNAYFSINAAKYKYEPMDHVQIASDLNAAFSVGDEFEVAVSYGGDLKRFAEGYEVNGTMNTAAIRAMLNSDKIKYFANAATEASGVAFGDDVLSFYAGTNRSPSTSPVTKLEFNDISVTTTVTTTTTVTITLLGIEEKISVETAVVTVDNNNAVPVTTSTTEISETITTTPNTNLLPDSITVTTSTSERTVTRSIYDTLALLDNGTVFQQQGDVYSERVNAVKTMDQHGNVAIVGEYSYIVKFKVIASPTVGSFVVNQCSIVAQALASSLRYSGSSTFSMTNHAQDTLIKQAVLLMNNASSNPAFYKGHLRVDYCASIKRQEFVKILAKCFDTGYTKKKVDWWKKVIAIVIIIIAIVIIVLTWWTGVGDAVGGSMMALGLGMMYASAFLTIAMMLYASAFPEATDQIGMIGKAATIVGYGAMVVAIWNVIQQSFQAAALDAANTSAINAAQSGSSNEAIMAAWNSSLSNFSAETFVDGIIEGVAESVSSVVNEAAGISIESIRNSFSNMTIGQVSGWIDNINTSMYYYNQFFASNPPPPSVASNGQSDKEIGVTGYYAALSMTENTDALDRMTRLKDNIVGGNMTENLIYSM